MIKYILLGIAQGVTEFLPVSSSAHLLIMQKLLGINGQEVVISVVLHLGTTLALIMFFFRDILGLRQDKKMLSFLIVVTIITGVIGVSGKGFFESLFGSVRLVALALAVTGIILLFARNFQDNKRKAIATKDGLILGAAQGIAIIPGISRSGITVSALLFRGIERETSFKLSFIASIPAVLGAVILEAKKVSVLSHAQFNALAVGFLFSLATGLASLWILRMVVRKSRWHYFGYYCIAVAVIVLLFIR